MITVTQQSPTMLRLESGACKFMGVIFGVITLGTSLLFGPFAIVPLVITVGCFIKGAIRSSEAAYLESLVVTTLDSSGQVKSSSKSSKSWITYPH
jgi:hypothetical protein